MTTTINVTDTSGTKINGIVKSGEIAVEGVTVSTNTSITTTTDVSGFYSLPVTAGTYQLTAAKDPVYYTNSSVTAAVETGINNTGWIKNSKYRGDAGRRRTQIR